MLQHGSVAGYVATIVGGTTLVVAFYLTPFDFRFGESSVLPLTVDGLIGAAIILGAIAATFTDSRIAAIAELGIVGMGVSLLFVRYGAPDLALTTLLVETLTLIVLIVIMIVFPVRDAGCERASRSRDVFVSLSVGLLVTLLVLQAQLQSPVFLLREFFGESSYLLAHGKNVVNVILVDFRALDTMGEITVLALAAIGVGVLARRRAS
jgi:multicomponent Na+:H+ antiporter subunit A